MLGTGSLDEEISSARLRSRAGFAGGEAGVYKTVGRRAVAGDGFRTAIGENDRHRPIELDHHETEPE